MSNWAILSGVFSINNLKSGAFAQLPTAHINEMLKRFQRVGAKRGQVVIREGDAGDYYYVLEAGKCLVERNVGGVSMKLAELKGGDAFGEEALVANAKRNATVTMLAEGSLFRLAKEDFNELLKKPLLQSVTMEQARAKIAAGGQWIDTRYPSEYQYDKLPGAINIPLSEVRNAVKVLDRSREYVLYCQSGRRSSAGAFLLAQRGFRAFVLEGGLRGGTAGPAADLARAARTRPARVLHAIGRPIVRTAPGRTGITRPACARGSLFRLEKAARTGAGAVARAPERTLNSRFASPGAAAPARRFGRRAPAGAATVSTVIRQDVTP